MPNSLKNHRKEVLLEITVSNGIVRPLLDVSPGPRAQMLEEKEQKVVRRKKSRVLW